VALLAFVFERRAAVLPRRPAAAAVDQYRLPAGPTAANPLHAAAAVEKWDRQTDGRTPTRYTDPTAYYASSVKNVGEKITSVKKLLKSYKNNNNKTLITCE